MKLARKRKLVRLKTGNSPLHIYKMNLQGSGNRRLNGPQELQEFMAAMAPRRLAITSPVATSSAANSVVVPWRM